MSIGHRQPWFTILVTMENVGFAKQTSLNIGFAAIFVAPGWACFVIPDKYHWREARRLKGTSMRDSNLMESLCIATFGPR